VAGKHHVAADRPDEELFLAKVIRRDPEGLGQLTGADHDDGVVLGQVVDCRAIDDRQVSAAGALDVPSKLLGGALCELRVRPVEHDRARSLPVGDERPLGRPNGGHGGGNAKHNSLQHL